MTMYSIQTLALETPIGEMIIAIIKLLTPTLKGWHKAFKTQGIMTPLRSSVTTYNC